MWRRGAAESFGTAALMAFANREANCSTLNSASTRLLPLQPNLSATSGLASKNRMADLSPAESPGRV